MASKLPPLPDDEVTKLMASGKSYDDRFDTRTPEQKAAGMHSTDKGKLPNYPTFSDESIYSKPGQEGGSWKKLDAKGNEVEERDEGTWHFYASPHNVMQVGVEGLQNHFKEHDNDSVLHLPSQEDMQNYQKTIFSNYESGSSFWAQ